MVGVRGLLIYNPAAGRNRIRRDQVITALTAALSAAGYSVQVVATTHKGSAGKQVADAIASSINVVFACGGDGTIHDVLQGIVGTSASGSRSFLLEVPMHSAAN